MIILSIGLDDTIERRPSGDSPKLAGTVFSASGKEFRAGNNLLINSNEKRPVARSYGSSRFA